MIPLTSVIFMVATLTGLSVLAGRVKNVPYPVLLVLAGLVIGFIPGLPVMKLEPDMVFLLFLPPLLYRSAWNTSWRDFKASISPISRLAIGLVFLTTLAVGAVAHYTIPGMSWPLSFVLGAIISPPDAVAASGIVRGIGLNKRIVTILEGESLVNDASALIAYRYAVAAIVTSGFTIWKAGIQFLWVASGGILIGFVIGYILCFILKRIQGNPTVECILSLLTPFIAYPLAERFALSGVLAVVSAGLVTSWKSSEVLSYTGRTQANAVWDIVGFLLNGVIFVLIGSQLSGMMAVTEGYKVSVLVLHGLVISGVVILARLLFIAPAIFFPRLLGSRIHEKEGVFNWKNLLVLSWSGMRGVVSLATAMALPFTLGNARAFPQRDIILFITFIVILVTLLGQGLTLPWLIRLLHIAPGIEEENEERKLRLLVAKKALAYINNEFYGQGIDKQVSEEVRKLYELRISWINGKAFTSREGSEHGLSPEETYLEKVVKAQLVLTGYKRQLLVKLYREGSYSAANIRRLEKELDMDESRLRSHL